MLDEHKTCKYFRYYSDGEGCYDGFECINKTCPETECPYFSANTYKCKYYMEGEDYGCY